jgi:hypothetical protein
LGWCESGLEMGFVSTILGLWGFGVGISIGLVIGYYMFIYFQPTDVKVSVSLAFFLLILHCNLILSSILAIHRLLLVLFG